MKYGGPSGGPEPTRANLIGLPRYLHHGLPSAKTPRRKNRSNAVLLRPRVDPPLVDPPLADPLGAQQQLWDRQSANCRGKDVLERVGGIS